MLQSPRFNHRRQFQPVQLSRQRSQSCGFLNHHSLHGREYTARRGEASTQITGEFFHDHTGFA